MAWYHRLLNVGRTERLNRDIDRELAFHIAETADALQASGMSKEAALHEARRRTGNAVVQRERTRDADVITWLDSVVRDVRHAVRGLRRAPVFTIVAVLSLAVGIGANTAIFTLLEAVILRPLPVPNPEELVAIGMADDDIAPSFTNPLWEELRDRQTGLSAVAAFGEARWNTAMGGEPRRVQGAYVSGDYFRLFGVQPALGRVLTRADDVRGCPPVAVLGSGFWRSEYGGASDVAGRTLALDGVAFEIVGVTRAGFDGPEVGRAAQVYLPLCAEAAINGERSSLDVRQRWWLRVMGRREPQLSVEQVSARLAAVAPGAYEATVPDRYGAEEQQSYREGTFTASAAPRGLSSLRERYGTALFMLMVGVALVLLIACANVANLLLARASAREREFAIRAAIGAGRARLARQLVTEALLFSLTGAALGLVIARRGADALVALIATQPATIVLDLSLNARVLLFTTGVAVVTALLFGLVPAWRAGRVDPQATMAGRGRGIAEGHGRFTLGRTLVAAQVALSLVLLAGAGLLVGSLQNLRALDPGFTAEGVLLADVDMARAERTPEQNATAAAQVLERLRATPGVRAASTSAISPMGRSRWNQRLDVDGFVPETETDAIALINEVSGGYFATMDTRLLAGRDFAATDGPGGPLVAIANASLARKFYRGDALGKTLRMREGAGLSDPYTIVGIVEDAKYRSLREETSETVYLAASQANGGPPWMVYEVRVDGDPAAITAALKSALADVHPAITVEFRTLSSQIAESLQRERMLAVLSALFGAMALALAMLGLYGVMAYAVSRRRNEIGVRIALGASRARVLRMVLGDVSRVVAIGVIAGIAGASASGRLVTSFLYGVSATEPAVLALAAALLTFVALAAGVIPAWRAARVDPVTALRDD
jgi:putative ABC transport system permease protein